MVAIETILNVFLLLCRDFSPALFNSAPILPSGSSMSNQLTSQLSCDSSPGQAPPLGLRSSQDPLLTSPPPNSATKVLEDNKDGYRQTASSYFFNPCLCAHNKNYYFLFCVLPDCTDFVLFMYFFLFCKCCRVKSCLLLTSASKIEPMKALDSRFTERSKATPGATAAIASSTGLTPLER